jgi:hypothetical protein
MALTTRSLFYYGFEVDSTNNALDFKEGAGSELNATLATGAYTLTTFVDEVERALNAAGALTYTVSVNRTTRIITIAASGTFSLLTTSGTRAGTSAYSLIGFSGADKTGTNTYAGGAASGSSYATQFVLQDYVSSEDSRGTAEATVNKSASGRVEVVSFGEERFVEFNLRFITNRNLGAGVPIRYSATGVADARAFLRYLIKREPFEFMQDEATPATFETLILETTPNDSKGVSYKLKEMVSQGLADFYETGALKCRVDLS